MACRGSRLKSPISARPSSAALARSGSAGGADGSGSGAAVEAVAEAVRETWGIQATYKFGTMIETPRAALTADEMAEIAEFFSFGTNDLTQTVFGISRDDAELGFLLHYMEHDVLPAAEIVKT